MKKHLLLLTAWLVGISVLWAQNASDRVVPITVTTNANPPSITLTFPTTPIDTITFIGRKLINQTQWSAIALPGNATSFTDNNVIAGVGFEYIVLKNTNSAPAQRVGFVYAGIEVLPTFYRGKMTLVVDNVLSAPLSMELDRLVQDLRGDGWQVLRHDIDVANSTVASVKALIRSDYESDPDNVTTALLFGNIPVPYSGNIAPDGHAEHQGAWPTDYYYGDMDEAAWTDVSVNNNTAARVANRNVPGDGKFDQSQTPTLAEIVVSRVDFSNLTTGWDVSQTELYRRYLNKNHAFRSGTYKPSNQTIVDDNFGYFGGEAFSQNGFRNGVALTGANSIVQGDFVTGTQNQSFLLGHGCGPGGYTSAAGAVTSSNFQTDSINIVFSMLFGSYFGDWDFENNPLMPSALASKGGILTCAWAGRPNWHLHHMGLGEPILTSTFWVWLNSFLQNPVYFPTNFGDDLIHVGLLGDPTLRAHAVRPPENVVATPSCETINLAWDASPDAQFGYLVYWAPDPDSIYQLIVGAPVFGTSFVDSFPVDGANYYLVRALKLETVPTGSYFNQSTGIGTSATFGGDPFTAEAAATHVDCHGAANGAITVVVSGGSGLTYAWSNGANTPDLSDLEAGTYTVTISDAQGCTATAEATIDEPGEIGISAEVTDVTCFGLANGGIALTVSGGVLPYGFEWSNGDTTQDLADVGAGTYSGTLTDGNGCLAVITDEVLEPAEIELTLTPTDADCNGASTGNIQTSASGGTLGYEFLWSNGNTSENLDDVPAGSYTVVLTDANGCTAEAGATLGEPEAINASTTSTDAGCAGATNGSVELTVDGGTPGYTFEWSNSSTDQNLADVAAGTYTVTITDATGCTVTVSATVDQATSLEVETSSAPVPCFGETGGSASVQAIGGTPDYAYLWSNNAMTDAIDNVSAGIYTVTVTDDAGCSQTATVTVGQPAEITAGAVWVADACETETGTVTMTVDGGTPGYTFEWSNGATTPTLENIAPGIYEVTISDVNGCTVVISNTVVQPPAPLSVQFDSEQTSCPDEDPALLTLYCLGFGGTPGYDYIWSTGATGPVQANSPVGTYTVTVTDADGCTAEQSITAVALIGPWEVSVTAVVEATCFGDADGAISISVSGATGPNYTYAWSNGSTTKDLSNVAADTYTITITDGAGCTTTETVSVSQPDQLVASVGTSGNVTCSGLSDGQASITASGGTPDYSYLWSDGSTAQQNTSLSAGTTSFTVTDANGCWTASNVTIAEPDPISGTIVGASVSCPGLSDGQASITADGGTPGYTYAWSNGAAGDQATGLSVGTVTCTITDANGCTGTASVVINEPVPPVVSIAGVDTACVDGTLMYSLPGSLGNFQWSVSGNGTITQGQGTEQIEVTWQTPGTGTVTGAYTWSANNCPDDVSLDVTVTICVSTQEPVLAGVRVLPNPFVAQLNVLFDRPVQAGTRLRLLNAHGRLLLEQSTVTETMHLETEHLPAGAYFLQIVENGAVGVWKVVKQF